MIIAGAAFTGAGAALLETVESALNETFRVYTKPEPLRPWVARQFSECDALVFIGAVGIAVRLLAGLPVSKDKDPAVIVIDEKGRFVIPILSGHIGGGNALATRIADAIGATPVITTATDINGVFAVDVWSVAKGCVIDEPGTIKHVSSAVLRGDAVGFASDFSVEEQLPEPLVRSDSGPVGLCVTLDLSRKPFDRTCVVIPRIVTLGVGCRKGTDYTVFESFVLETLEARRISVKSLAAVASIDIKEQEPCILHFAKEYNLPFITYSAEQLKEAEGDFAPSEFVAGITGVDNVCERSAALHSGGALIINKTSGKGVTVAAAMARWTVTF